MLIGTTTANNILSHLWFKDLRCLSISWRACRDASPLFPPAMLSYGSPTELNSE